MGVMNKEEIIAEYEEQKEAEHEETRRAWEFKVSKFEDRCIIIFLIIIIPYIIWEYMM